ncbi:hypothetical protein [Amycolatopsis sp. RTGN1]|uniref:hypothetical protein n=1 Tax=Amycolatopsis ponsaeliensis TaxID=2992142 RepID=UPI00254FB3A9|nr:hypothetical protein [Amycolatopsis sp. RTGN1]
MDKAEYVAQQLHHMAPDRRLKDVVSAVRLIDHHRTANPSPEHIQAQLTKILSSRAPFTQLPFIAAAVKNLANRA